MIDWTDLATKKAFVLHVPTQIVGRVERFWDGVNDVHLSINDRRPVMGPVVAFESGHTYVAKDENFVPLEEHEALFYVGMVQVFGEGIKAVVKLGAENNVMPATINVLIIAALKTQAMVLESGHRRAFGGSTE